MDSGAFYSIFDDSISELLELDLPSGKKMTAVVGDGGTIPFYLHKVKIQLGSDQFEMEVGFSKQLKVGFNILGLDIFNRYQVTFDSKKKNLILRRH